VDRYKYEIIDPRKNRSLYFYAEFEGESFLRAWARSRDKLIALELRPPEAIEAPIGLHPAKGFDFKCEEALRSCATALVMKSVDPDILADWAVFVGNKIDRFHRLRASYTADGRAASDEDAGGASYAFAAYLLAWLALLRKHSAERLKWTNALLKCLDVVSCMNLTGLDRLSRYCVAKAAESERGIIQGEIDKLSIPVKV
jgi:hypothetical protein